MSYKLRMKGVYVGAFAVKNSTGDSDYVLVEQDRYVLVEAEGKDVEDALDRVCKDARNATRIEVIEPVDGTMRIARTADKYASKEQIEQVANRLDHLEVPSHMVLAGKSLEPDLINTVMT